MGSVPRVTLPPDPTSTSHIGPTMYAAQIDRFLDSVLNDVPPICNGHDGLMGMQVLEAAYRSAGSGQAVSLTGGP
jgi:predicted dehydrogenase